MQGTTKNDLIIRIGGEGGEGVISVGDFITQAVCERIWFFEFYAVAE